MGLKVKALASRRAEKALALEGEGFGLQGAGFGLEGEGGALVIFLKLCVAGARAANRGHDC